MIFLLASFVWFILAAVLHICFHKIRLMLNMSWSIPLLIFVVGLIGCILTTVWLTSHAGSFLPLPLTSIVLYIAFSFAYIAITASPSLGDESPSSKIVLQLLRKGPQTESQILSIITDKDDIGSRLQALIETGWVRENRGTLTVTPLGKGLAQFFWWYRSVLGMNDGGSA